TKMAGNYPDVPAPRMAYDRDGTIGLFSNTSFLAAPTQWSQGQLDAVNSEGTSGLGGGFNLQFDASMGYILLFPQLRDVAGITIGLVNVAGSKGPLQWSADTT